MKPPWRTMPPLDVEAAAGEFYAALRIRGKRFKPMGNKDMNEINLTEELRVAIERAERGNGEGGAVEVFTPDPVISRRMAAVRAGMQETQALFAERDQYKRLYEEERVRNAELVIQIDQAREQERLHVGKVVQESVVAGRAAEAERDILRDEIDQLNLRLRAGDAKLREAFEQVARYRAFVGMVRAAIDKTIDDVGPPDGTLSLPPARNIE